MKNKKHIIIYIVLIIIICSIVIIFKNKSSLYNSKTDEYECSFTKTYMVSALWTVDVKENIPGMSHVILKQYQIDDTITLIIPTELRDKLQEGKYYEFTYTIKGKNDNIKTMDDINTYFLSNNNNSELKITVDAQETDKKGLDQIQENICSINE